VLLNVYFDERFFKSLMVHILDADGNLGSVMMAGGVEDLVVLFWFLIQRSCKMPLKCIAGSWSF
jgi:hypothetical protein